MRIPFFVVLSILLTCTPCLFLQAQTEKQLLRRGIERLENQDYANAEGDFSMVLKLNPANGAAYYNRGFARLQLGAYTGAVSDFSLSLEINPANPEGYYNRGLARLNLEEYLMALRDFNTAIKGREKDPRYYQMRARAKSGLEDFRGAIQDMTVCINLTKGRNLDFFYERAEYYIALNQFAPALRDLDYIVGQRPLDPDAYNARAAVRYQAEDLEGACLDWSKAGELGDASAYDRIRINCTVKD